MLEPKLRSVAQNKALHKLFGDISAHCVATGLDQRTIVAALQSYDCPTTPQFIKESWRAMQVAITGKKSTKDLTRAEVDQVYDVFNKFWSELSGEHFAFPSMDALLDHEDLIIY